jgi:hypothetical protein
MKKKELERLCIERFLEVLTVQYLGKLVDHENPDFLLVGKDGTVGIELTRLYREATQGDSPLKEQEVLREQTMKRAKDIYDARHLPPIHVSVHFNHSCRLKKNELADMAATIADLGERNIPLEGGSQTEEYNWMNRAYFPDTIDCVMVFRSKALTKSTWSAPSVGFLPELNPTQVALKIADKEQRLTDYLRACDRAWLVLMSNGDMLASVVDLGDEAKEASYPTRFSRVFWFKWPDHAYELKVGQ